MAEFSGYIIAAQATIDPAAYITFCRQWWGAKQLPDRWLYPMPHLASRVAGASRAMRRLSRGEHRALLHDAPRQRAVRPVSALHPVVSTQSALGLTANVSSLLNREGTAGRRVACACDQEFIGNRVALPWMR